MSPVDPRSPAIAPATSSTLVAAVAPPASVAKSPGSTTPVPAESAPTPPSALTPDEQMALYEKELKETDWGHQPC